MMVLQHFKKKNLYSSLILFFCAFLNILRSKVVIKLIGSNSKYITIF